MNRYQIAARLGSTILLWLFSVTVSFAGGGPENVFLIVNSASSDSLTIANYFSELRKVPTSCVFEIDWPNAPLKTDIDTFRNKMLGPILNEIKRRKLTKQIDYIIYSSGFPYAVDFSTDLVGEANDRYPLGSITGLTFLHELVMASDASYRIQQVEGGVRMGAINFYAASVLPNRGGESQGFRAQYGIDPLGKRIEQGDGSRYYLSMLLGETCAPRNNTLPEVLRYLLLGSQADGKQPKGTIYLVKNSNIRSTVRHDLYPEVVEELIDLGVNAEVIEGGQNRKECLPLGKQDVMGAMIGFSRFAWSLSGSRILPGAICEHFTSWGGDLSGSHKHSLVFDFLRQGAVAASGTVTEPYAIPYKFPHPRMHVHYARGCSVAEAFYQSVLTPYQLIIVGDPLCQPWGVAPEVRVTGLDTKKAMSGVQEINVSAKSKLGNSIRNYDIFIDGVLLLRALPGKPIKLDTTKLANGYHELRVVAVEETKIETQGRAIMGFVSMNESGDPSVAKPTGVTSALIPRSGKIRPGAIGYVKVQSRGAREIRLYKGRQLIGNVPGESGQIRFSASELGGGTSTLTPVAVPKAGGAKPVFGFPVKVNVQMGT